MYGYLDYRLCHRLLFALLFLITMQGCIQWGADPVGGGGSSGVRTVRGTPKLHKEGNDDEHAHANANANANAPRLIY